MGKYKEIQIEVSDEVYSALEQLADDLNKAETIILNRTGKQELIGQRSMTVEHIALLSIETYVPTSYFALPISAGLKSSIAVGAVGYPSECAEVIILPSRSTNQTAPSRCASIPTSCVWTALSSICPRK